MVSEKVKYQIATTAGSAMFREGWQVGAFAIAEVPGLMFSVDHLGTGMKAGEFKDINDAVLFALELNSNADWSFTDKPRHLSEQQNKAYKIAVQASKRSGCG